jgi:uncharacterized protein YcbK (DUF882 family)
MDDFASRTARSSFRLRSAAFLVGAAVALLSVYAEAGDVVHVVAKGQVLVHIARRYHTTVDAIVAANGLRRGQLLKLGQELVIPEKGKEAEAAKKAAALKASKESGGKKGAEASPKESAAGSKGKKKGEAKPAKPEPIVMKPKRPGFVRIARGAERLETQLLTRHGRLVPSALPGLGKMMRHGPSGSKVSIEPRLATLIGMVSDHFGGRTIHITSGFRPYSPTQYTKHSNHNLGRAIDFSIEGVPNTMLRDFCRTFRNAGVGYYPNSTFVHLDVRTTKAFWIDYSRPGEAPRYDSPVAQASADESTADVDQAPSGATPVPSGTGKETPPTPLMQGGGSGDTHPPPSQVVDPSTGNSSSQDPTPPNAKPAGQN